MNETSVSTQEAGNMSAEQALTSEGEVMKIETGKTNDVLTDELKKELIAEVSKDVRKVVREEITRDMDTANNAPIGITKTHDEDEGWVAIIFMVALSVGIIGLFIWTVGAWILPILEPFWLIKKEGFDDLLRLFLTRIGI